MKSDKLPCSHDEIDILFALNKFDYHYVTKVLSALYKCKQKQAKIFFLLEKEPI